MSHAFLALMGKTPEDRAAKLYEVCTKREGFEAVSKSVPFSG